MTRKIVSFDESCGFTTIGGGGGAAESIKAKNTFSYSLGVEVARTYWKSGHL